MSYDICIIRGDDIYRLFDFAAMTSTALLTICAIIVNIDAVFFTPCIHRYM